MLVTHPHSWIVTTKPSHKTRVMVRLKKKTPMRERLMSLDYSMLARSEIKESFCKEVFDNYNTNDSNIPKYTKLANVVKTATTRTLPKRKRTQPEWFKEAEDELVPLIEKRNAAMKAFFNRRTRSNAKSLKTIRKTFKSTIQKAKNNWIEAKRNELDFGNAVKGTKHCWEALKQLRNGLCRMRPSAEKNMTKEDGSRCKTPGENAEVFRGHFQNLYGVPPTCDEIISETIP